ncbi:MAG TPA: helix-hairpin-helix domain-containing protein, partial [Gemmatimonadales bacterium]|nr:helix-hairpin-helix domain-containing protein [Gemmatimonadales bacterium]
MPPRRRAPRPTDDLETLPSIGPSLAQDLRDLGVSSVAALRRRDPERLYAALNALRGQRQDPCVLYSFRCATYAARTARPRPELLLWWNWKGRTLALLLFLLQGITGPRLTAQALGSISFPNSGAPAAQAPFLRGMLLLHSFEYEDAAAAFREAEAADSTFALARWGEAMTYTHPLWNQQDTAAARAVLLRLGARPSEVDDLTQA